MREDLAAGPAADTAPASAPTSLPILTRPLQLTLIGLLIACGLWTLSNLDLKALGTSLLEADLYTLVVTMPALIIGTWVLRAARWGTVLQGLGCHFDPLRLYLQTAVSLGLAVATPAQSGELVKIAYARGVGGGSVNQLAGGFAVERIFDILSLVALTALALVLTTTRYGNAWTYLLLVLAVFCAGVSGLLFSRRRLPASIREAIDAATRMSASVGRLAVIAALSLLCWILSAVLWQASMAAVSVDVPLSGTIILVGLVLAANILSLLPGGLGVSELTTAGALLVMGYSAEQGVAAALMLRMITVLCMVAGLLHWIALRYLPVRPREE